MNRIDINCDMGESYGNFQIGNDSAVFPYITSSNIACGFHGGDPLHIESTIKKALDHNVQVGAHPGYPDLLGFGRRRMHITPEDLRALVKYQVAALKSLTESLGGKLTYVKPHGALYNTAADHEEDARAIARAVVEISPELLLMGLPGGYVESAAAEYNLQFVPEAFADRRYESNGRLRVRTKENAVIDDAEMAAEQVLNMVQNQSVVCYDGSIIPMMAQSICIHGDNPIAVDILKAIDEKLNSHSIEKKGFAQ